MLYEGAIRFLQQAQEARGYHETALRTEKLRKAGDIVAALQSALDIEQGGALGRGLFDFYSTIGVKILGLARQDSLSAYAEVVNELRSMRDMWDAIDRDQQSA